jgi:hypothetical protein
MPQPGTDLQSPSRRSAFRTAAALSLPAPITIHHPVLRFLKAMGVRMAGCPLP